ncbi:SitA6 family polymorphic toxin lipoprotein [Corallococcus llansteffanensis]|uniref:TIGR02269 family lipoprotein n=1 Tax=Corallococcus llansteffanensis TaxID=2316731 RepID=A0A3A8P9M8_9BACT|nr:TIGR02269 family lipoprotein [Corallococcus llansteffanensis]RKH53063.1 TIGR02269 family lipoprotein [Corallococcus llansteffanensis]
MRWLSWLFVALWCGCASTAPVTSFSPEAFWAEAETEQACEDSGEDQCLAPLCTDEACALFRCEDLEPDRVVRTRGALAPPVFVAPGSGPQRNWGSAQGLPDDTRPVMVFRWHPREKLPSQVRRERAMEEWAKRPKERHHIFPQAFKEHFDSKRIDIHQYVLAVDVDVHKRIHRGKNGGPWNQEWQTYIEGPGATALRNQHFDQAFLMIQKHGLFGLTMTYWQQVDLMPMPVED